MPKYTGPCVVCGKMNVYQYSKRMCMPCYARYQRSPDYAPNKRYDGPCVNCGSRSSSSGRFIQKMCQTCYNRIWESGNEVPRRKYPGPCIACGTMNPGSRYFHKKMCRACYKHAHYEETHQYAPKYCIDCGKRIGHKARQPRCGNCRQRYRYQTEKRARELHKATAQRYLATPAGREVAREHVRRRRAKMKEIEPILSIEQWRIVLAKYDNRCAYCGSRKRIEMDHVIPLSKGGTHDIHNVVPACRSCNNKKNAQPPPKSVQCLLL